MNALDFRKRAIMSVINNVKGFERSASGTSVTLEGCVDDDSIIDYKIYGNCYQDGEPSIDNPIEVVSVGEKTNNLFSYSALLNPVVPNPNGKYTVIDDNHIVWTRTSTNSSGMFQGSMNLKAGTYSIKVEICDVVGYVPDEPIALYMNGLRFTDGASVAYDGKTKYLTLTEDTKVTLTLYSRDSTANRAVGNSCGWKVMVAYGKGVADYEPYGYKIPIKASGKNIANFSIVNAQYNVKTEKIAPNIFKVTKIDNEETAYGQIETYVETGKTYTLFRMVESEKPIHGIHSWKGYNASSYYNSYISAYYTFTATQEKFILGLYPNKSANLKGLETTFTFMLVEGSYTSTTFPDYEPYYEPITTNIYLDEPLRGIDSYLDCVGYKDENVTRDVWKMYFADMRHVYMGEGYASVGNGFYRNGICFPSGGPNNIYPMKIMTAGGGFCNKLPNHKGNYHIVTKESLRFGQNHRGIILYTSLDSKDKTEVFNHIGAEDCYAVYILNNSFETPITLPKLPTFKGTTIYKVGTSLQPANIEIKYYSNIKGE